MILLLDWHAGYAVALEELQCPLIAAVFHLTVLFFPPAVHLYTSDKANMYAEGSMLTAAL
jgi:hypothetical protein